MERNRVGSIIRVIGIMAIILGIIASVVAGSLIPIITTYGADFHTGEEIYNWPLAIGGSISSFISGILLVGFAEIIDLLHKGVRNIERMQGRHR